MPDPSFSQLRRALSTGRPAPVPPWVTREVVHSGSALAGPVAGGRLEADEVELSQRLGMGASRWAILRGYLTREAMDGLYAELAAGHYEIRVPEDAALLTVAWLVRKGKRQAALEVVTAMGPVADEVRLAPRLTPVPVVPPEHVSRVTAGRTRASLAAAAPSSEVLAQTEALRVWNPLTDDLVALWLEVLPHSESSSPLPSAWRRRALAAVQEADRLAAVHTRCGRPSRTTSGLSVMIRHLRLAATRGRLTVSGWHTVARVVDGTVARRGTPGSPDHERRRAAEARAAAPPTGVAVAHLVAERLRDHPEEDGIVDVDSVLAPVTRQESHASGVPAGTPVPARVRRVVDRARARRLSELLDSGLVPSGHVLAEVVRPLGAASTAAGSDGDPVLATLMSACWRAHERHTSAMDPDLRRRHRFEQLPWVAALGWRPSRPPGERALRVVREVAGRALTAFPGRALPGTLVLWMRDLLDGAGVGSQLVDEVHAPHELARHADRHAGAVALTARHLGDTVYGRYFDLDVRVASGLRPAGLLPARVGGPSLAATRPPRRRVVTGPTLLQHCAQRADVVVGASAQADHAVLEQARILVADNVAALLELGVAPVADWADLAEAAFSVVCAEVAHSRKHGVGPRASDRAHRRAQVAWRQVVLDLALTDDARRATVLAGMRERLRSERPAVQRWVTPNIRSLEHVVAGGRLRPGGA
jgi:hypothetical protein